MNKGRKQVEDSVYNSRGVIWTYSNVIWTHELTSNILDYDEQDSLRSN